MEFVYIGVRCNIKITHNYMRGVGIGIFENKVFNIVDRVFLISGVM